MRSPSALVRPLTLCLLTLQCALPLLAQAQVIRCTDPATGSVTYTDGECDKGQSRKEVAPRQTPQDIQRQYEQAQEALRLQREQQQVQQAAQPSSETPLAATAAHPSVAPSQSAECYQARAALQSALALDPMLYDTSTRISAAQQNVDLACLTPAQYARSRHGANERTYGEPGYATPVIVVPPRPAPRPHKTERKPQMVQCNVFRCYDAQGNSYPH